MRDGMGSVGAPIPRSAAFSLPLFADFWRSQQRDESDKRYHRQRMRLVSLYCLRLDMARALPRLALTSCPIHVRAPGVYLLWRGPALLYVGSAHNLGLRLYGHWKAGWPMGRPDSITVLPVENARELEAVLIERLRPLRNLRLERKRLVRAGVALLYPYRLLAGLDRSARAGR